MSTRVVFFREKSGVVRYVTEPFDEIEDSDEEEIGLYYEFEKKCGKSCGSRAFSPC